MLSTRRGWRLPCSLDVACIQYVAVHMAGLRVRAHRPYAQTAPARDRVAWQRHTEMKHVQGTPRLSIIMLTITAASHHHADQRRAMIMLQAIHVLLTAWTEPLDVVGRCTHKMMMYIGTMKPPYNQVRQAGWDTASSAIQPSFCHITLAMPIPRAATDQARQHHHHQVRARTKSRASFEHLTLWTRLHVLPEHRQHAQC